MNHNLKSNGLDDPSPSRHSVNGFWIVAPLILAACVAAAGWWVVKSTEKTLRSSLAVKLETVVRVESEAVSAWIESKKQAFKVLARRIHSRRHQWLDLEAEFESGELDMLAQSLGVRDYSYLSKNTHSALHSKNSIFVNRFEDSSFAESFSADNPLLIFVADDRATDQLTRKQIASDESQSSSPASGMIMVLAGRCHSHQGIPDSKARRSQDDRNNEVLAVGIPVSDELTQIVSSSLMGNSGETLVFDRNGNLLSLSRFMIGSFKNELVDRMLARQTFKEVDYSGFLDSRDQKVVGASQWNPAVGIGLVTKIDYDEATAPISHVKQFIVILCVSLFLAALSLLIYQYLRIRQNNLRREKELQQRKLGMYHLQERIGEGGMGIVYQAQHQLLTRPTAIKILSPKKSSNRSVKRFEREVQFTSQLKHPNTISIYDYGRTDHGLFYYAMEFVEGLTLDQLVSRAGCLTDGRTVHVLIQICDSLIEAHNQGLIHRDIKPSNVMLCELGCVPDHVKVLDFGMVRDLSDSSNGQIGLSGTPLYMPPEALKRSASIDQRFDIFSIGAVGYFLLTGKHFRDSANLNQLVNNCHQWTQERIAQRLRDHFEDRASGISDQLVDIVAQCAAPDPKDRISTIVELKKLLQDCVIHDPWDENEAKAWWRSQPDYHSVSGPERKRMNSWSMPTDSFDRTPESNADSGLLLSSHSGADLDIYDSTICLEDDSQPDDESRFCHIS